MTSLQSSGIAPSQVMRRLCAASRRWNENVMIYQRYIGRSTVRMLSLKGLCQRDGPGWHIGSFKILSHGVVLSICWKQEEVLGKFVNEIIPTDEASLRSPFMSNWPSVFGGVEALLMHVFVHFRVMRYNSTKITERKRHRIELNGAIPDSAQVKCSDDLFFTILCPIHSSRVIFCLIPRKF